MELFVVVGEMFWCVRDVEARRKEKNVESATQYSTVQVSLPLNGSIHSFIVGSS